MPNAKCLLKISFTTDFGGLGDVRLFANLGSTSSELVNICEMTAGPREV